MQTRPIEPISRPLKARVRVPGSKSITQRALICAALAEGRSVLKGALQSEDPELLAQALRAAGVKVESAPEEYTLEGVGNRLRLSETEVFMGNNGTGSRFFLALAALSREGSLVLTGTERLCERPVKPLIDALEQWGARIEYLKEEGFLPVRIHGSGLKGGPVELAAAKSSQFLSALLLVGPYTSEPAEIRLISPLVSRPYVDLTIAVMEAFGAEIDEEGPVFRVAPKPYQPREYEIEGDASSASYFLAAAALVGGEVTVENLPRKSLQGDAAFAGLLSRMGCEVSYENGVTVRRDPEQPLRGIDVNMGRYPDLVPTLAIVAAKAHGKTHIRGVPHLRYKETDRLRAVATELTKCGAKVEELEDGLIIEGPGDLRGAEIETYEDHRLAMAFAILGLTTPGMVIRNPACVGKSFPNFWEVFESLY
ncbi:MAG: 3-phosphoshikimate 1-carboxyvinyltransferase [Thermodesulfobacteria bacterium]|nr:3-phosphoshikimate 1-carboxyvinyltransferase [Thermodesulfobacteriota bacterium]